MENTPRSLTTSDSVRHSTPLLSFDKNDSNALKSLPITPSFTKLNPSALIFQPKLHFSASTSNFQSSSQLRSSSQPFLRQLTSYSPTIESPAQVIVHDTFSSTSSQLTISSSPHKLISPLATSNSSRPSSPELSPLLSPLNDSKNAARRHFKMAFVVC